MTTSPELIQLGPLQIRFLVDPATVNRSLSMFEVVVAVNARVPIPHAHVAFDETIYGLEGTCTLTVNGVEAQVSTGDALFIPRGAVHHFINRGATTCRFLAVVTPGLLGPDYFLEIGELIRGGGPPDLKRLAEIMKRHGLEPVV